MHAQRMDRHRDARTADGNDVTAGEVQRLGDHSLNLVVQVPWLPPGHQPAVAQVAAIGEPLSDHPYAPALGETRQLPTRLGHDRHREAQDLGDPAHRVSQDLRGLRIAHRLVVEGPMRLDVGQSGTPALGFPRHEQHLLDQVGDKLPTHHHVQARVLQA